jgi:hypothetical protein
MKIEAMVLGLLGLASLYYLKKVEEVTLSTQDLFRASAAMVNRHEDRLVRVEEAVSEVPAIQEDIREIKKILLARGLK